ncbi:CAP-associated domain-containing protein [Enterococcus cecorum]
MKYRKLSFMIIFISVLLFVYLQPVFYPMNKKINSQSNTVKLKQPRPRQNTENIVADLYAQMIGQDIKAVRDKLPTELQKVDTGYGYTEYLFANQHQNYDVLTNHNGKIQELTVFGNKGKVGNHFHLGMDLEDLISQADISSSLSIKMQDKEYQFELSEEDMNYRPFISYNNQVYAICYFHPITGKLFAIRYLDAHYLLKVAPYQLIKGQYETYENENRLANWEALSVQKANYFLTLFSRLDEKKYQIDDSESASVANEALAQFEQSPEKVLSTARILQLKEMRTQRTEPFFTFTTDEMKHLTDSLQLENVRGIFLAPSIDCMDVALQLQTNPILHNKLTNNQAKVLSIAFHKQDMLVLILDEG